MIINNSSGENNVAVDMAKFGPEPPLIDLAELRSWILHEDEDLLAVNKPGWVVCHPSKRGPMSSLVGACRELTGLDTLHLVSRLDRETSGIVILAKHKKSARICQMALQERLADKVYIAILTGEMTEAVHVNKAMIEDSHSLVAVKMMVRKCRGAQTAKTDFMPLISRNGWTLAKVRPLTGRKHQIRVHAQFLGHAVAGDKLYGPDETLYLEFVEKGWTERLHRMLPLPRQALHAALLAFRHPEFQRAFYAPPPADLAAFCSSQMSLGAAEMASLEMTRLADFPAV